MEVLLNCILTKLDAFFSLSLYRYLKARYKTHHGGCAETDEAELNARSWRRQGNL